MAEDGAVKTRRSNLDDAIYQTPIFHFSDHTYFLFVKLLWQVDVLNLAGRLEVSRTLNEGEGHAESLSLKIISHLISKTHSSVSE